MSPRGGAAECPGRRKALWHKRFCQFGAVRRSDTLVLGTRDCARPMKRRASTAMLVSNQDRGRPIGVAPTPPQVHTSGQPRTLSSLSLQPGPPDRRRWGAPPSGFHASIAFRAAVLFLDMRPTALIALRPENSADFSENLIFTALEPPALNPFAFVCLRCCYCVRYLGTSTKVLLGPARYHSR